MPEKNGSVFLIGAGRIAFHLGLAFKNAGIAIKGVYNRSHDAGVELAKLLDVDFISELSRIEDNHCLFLLCVSDDAIEEVISCLHFETGILAHTSGSKPISILSKSAVNTGVFYPVQTFGSREMIDLHQVPFCIEANNPVTASYLMGIAEQLSEKVVEMDSESRGIIHLSAVFANNFSNFMYVVSEDLMNRKQLDISLLLPLIRQTCHHLPEKNFYSRQTGPAVRGDNDVIAMHFDLLQELPDYREIYQILTQQLMKFKARYGKL